MTTFGVLAEFESAADVYHACEKVRDAGFRKWDAHTPFPVHGLDKAMGQKRSILPLIVFVMGLTGASSALLLQWWTSAVDYKLVIAAKPFFSWQAFVPVCFEVMVLFSALGAVFGMLFLSRLPQWYHPLFRVERFKRFSDDRFFISIEAADPRFSADETPRFLKTIGATNVDVVEE
jgi:hypothetical protein